jgi:hypothetical protein
MDLPLLIGYLRRPGGLSDVRRRLRRGACVDGHRDGQIRALQRLVIMSLNPGLPETGPFESRSAVAEFYVELALAWAEADPSSISRGAGPALLRAVVLTTAGLDRWGRRLRAMAANQDTPGMRDAFDSLRRGLTGLGNREIVDAGLHLSAYLATGLGCRPADLSAWAGSSEPSPVAFFTEAMMIHLQIGGRISARLPARPLAQPPLMDSIDGAPGLSVIITTGNRLQDLRRMLPSLQRQDLEGIEVIFSVFADTQDTAAWLQSHMSENLRRHARILETPSPRFSKARAQQLACEGAVAPLLLFLDCDLELLDPILFRTVLREGADDPLLMRSIEHRGMICTAAAAWRASQHVLNPVAERQLAGHPREIDDVIMIGEHLHRFGRYEMLASHRMETITVSDTGAWTATVTGGRTAPALVHLREDRTDQSRTQHVSLVQHAHYNQVARASAFLPELTRLRRYVTHRRL